MKKRRFRELKKGSHLNQKRENSSVVYARYTDRIKAFITDLFMIYTPILYAITYVVLGNKEAFQHSFWGPFSAVVLYGIIYALFLSKTGQTPGKKAYKIKVVDAKTHQNISFIRALFRFVAFLFDATILVGLFFPFYNKEKKALHDMMANTIEIEVKE
ncbi:Putative integral membrane protein [hydrothermal vent metagenome]|uniref:Putative integral membrane protein n=1 Tax=hydrothermal vent metagenome TaxID=652676 RepID=A0A1W1BHU4_9ZZZZ